MTFQQMQYVLEVYRAGSVSAAAKKLFVGQPSISLCISSLEKELGYPVFHRLKNGVVPTPRGREVIKQAARICESYQIITGPEQEGPVQICIGGGKLECCRKAALQLLEENKHRKDVLFQFSGTGGVTSIQQVVLFELDLFLKFAFAPQMHVLDAQLRDKGLERIELAEYPIAVHLGQGHPLYDAPNVDLSMLEDDYLIDTPSKSMATSAVINSMLLVRPDRVLTAEDLVLRTQLLDNGHGYAIKPALPQEKGRFRQIPLGNLRVKFLAIYNPARAMRPEVARYLELLREELDSRK